MLLLLHNNAFSLENTYILFDGFSAIVHSKKPENADGNDSMRLLFRRRLRKLPFSTVHSVEKQSVFRTMRFEKTPLLKQFSNGCFSVDDGRKRAKKHVFKKLITVLGACARLQRN